jgi:hypothetical protein
MYILLLIIAVYGVARCHGKNVQDLRSGTESAASTGPSIEWIKIHEDIDLKSRTKNRRICGEHSGDHAGISSDGKRWSGRGGCGRWLQRLTMA